MKALLVMLIITMVSGCAYNKGVMDRPIPSPWDINLPTQCQSATHPLHAFQFLNPNAYDYKIHKSIPYSEYNMKNMKNFLHIDLSTSIYSEVSSDIIISSDNGIQSNSYQHKITSNLHLHNAIVEYKRDGKCIVGVALMTKADAEQTLFYKERLDRIERKDWEVIKTSIKTSDYENFLKMYPLGKYREIAYERIARIYLYQKTRPRDWVYRDVNNAHHYIFK